MNSFASRLRAALVGPSARRYWLIAGLLFVYAGQRQIRAAEPFTEPALLLDTLDRWNDKLQLGLPYPFDMLTGLVLIGVGSILFGGWLKLGTWTNNTENPEAPIPPEIHWKRALPWFAASLVLFLVLQVQLAQHNDSILIFWGWLVTILVPTLLIWLYERRAGLDLSLSIKRIDAILILILFGFAVAVSAFLLADLPLWVIGDEGTFWEIARSVAIGELRHSFFDVGVYTFPFASSMFQGWILRWAGINLWGWRFASVLPACIAVIPLYLLARDLFDRRVALACAVILIVNPYFLSFARLGYNNSQALLPVVLCIYFLNLALRKNSKFFLWLAGLSAGLGFYTYFAAWLGFAVAITVLPIAAIRSGGLRKLLPSLGIFLVAWLAVILPRILYGLSGSLSDSLYYKIVETTFINPFYARAIFGKEPIAESFIMTVSNNIEILYEPKLYGIMLTRGLIRTLLTLFDNSLYQDHFVISELAGPGSSIFLALGLGVVLINFKKLRFFTLASWFLIGLVFLGIIAAFPPRA
ncbi:MAG TPA: glycosyltransferase family 39 protein, partial [Anaerolineales bacterium]|nr:glycosyltransferase family 39 protein [Anaerolineales bacterium]